MIPYAIQTDLARYLGSDVTDLPLDADRLLLRASELIRSYTLNRAHRGEKTKPIAFDASADDVRFALEALEDIDSGDVMVTGSDGGPWIITFQGSYADRDMPELVGDGRQLMGSGVPSVIVDTLQDGDWRFDQDEIQQVRLQGSPTGGTFTLQFGLHTAALRDATCAQVEYWLQTDESQDVGGLIQGVQIGSLQIQYGAGTNRVTPGRLAPRAMDALMQSGLLYRGVMST